MANHHHIAQHRHVHNAQPLQGRAKPGAEALLLVEHERVRQQDRLHSPVLRVEALPVVEHRVIGHLACDRIVLEKAHDSPLEFCPVAATPIRAWLVAQN